MLRRCFLGFRPFGAAPIDGERLLASFDGNGHPAICLDSRLRQANPN